MNNMKVHESDETGYSDSFALIHQIDMNHKSSSICWVSGVLLFTEVCNLKRLVSDIILLPISANTKPITIIGYSSKENCVCVCVLRWFKKKKKKKKKLIRLFFLFVTFWIWKKKSILEQGDGDPFFLFLVPQKYRQRESKTIETVVIQWIGHWSGRWRWWWCNEVKFEISFELKLFEDCEKYATHPQQFYRLISICLKEWLLDIALKTLMKSGDLSTLLLVYKSQGKELKKKSKNWSKKAEEEKQYNVAFSAAVFTNQYEKFV